MSSFTLFFLRVGLELQVLLKGTKNYSFSHNWTSLAPTQEVSGRSLYSITAEASGIAPKPMVSTWLFPINLSPRDVPSTNQWQRSAFYNEYSENSFLAVVVTTRVGDKPFKSCYQWNSKLHLMISCLESTVWGCWYLAIFQWYADLWRPQAAGSNYNY